ncbi:MAG: mechanosensitive ion channel family protein [Methylophilus sp.]|uniref:mechanosensitive ion channel family protein n=1 Tax=Methylophilus sp. TaxID=29541 RepID=UPI002D0915EC|nr:mechanosensitive ion channel domain-containing protein [Methylophilus sp.]HSH87971.1 mechanosensitive ion channel domain-containing protein [Methylophilus sp.]
MDNDINFLWKEIVQDLNTVAALWQFLVIGAVLAISGLLNLHLRKQIVAGKVNTVYKLLLGGIQRLFFPFVAFLLLVIARYSLQHWMHVGLLRLAARMLLAMIIIRSVVYILRYVFSPSAWLHSFERVISWSVWVLVALHIGGFLDPLLQILEDVQFKVGKQKLNLLLLMQGALTIVVTMLVALWLSRMIELRLMASSNINSNWRVIMVKLVRMVAIVIALLMSMAAVGIDVTMLSVFGGALGVGLGFGLQKIASNYVSGFIILMDKSLHLGDIITISSHYGIVKELRSRYMVLRKQDGTEIIVPNEMMITDVVINHTTAAHKAKVPVQVQISYQSDLDLAMQLLKEVGKTHERTILDDNAVDVTIKSFGQYGIDLLLAVWVLNPEEATARLQSDIYYEIWQRFKANNIHIPYPQQEVRIISDQAALNTPQANA